MATNSNADEYANQRVGIYFPGVIWQLDGQCVSLAKWFMGEMSQVPDWNSARGDARYVGQTLVRQGHAYEVSRAEAKRGDLVIWEYGQYGHIAVLLSGWRIFQQNANVPGVASKIVDGSRVYASSIVPIYNSLGGVAPKFYRLKTYVENVKKEETTMVIQNAENWYSRCNLTHWFIRGRELDRAVFAQFVGKEFLTFVEVCSDDPQAQEVQNWQNVGKVAVQDRWDKQIYDLQDQVKALGSRPTPEQLKALQDQVASLTTTADNANKKAAAAEEKAKKLQDQANIDYEAGKSIFRRIGIMLGLIKE